MVPSDVTSLKGIAMQRRSWHDWKANAEACSTTEWNRCNCKKKRSANDCFLPALK